MKIETNYPGGNIVVKEEEGNVVKISPDFRDTAGFWFYYNFRVSESAGKTFTFEFEQDMVAPFGPAVSYDGENWAFYPELTGRTIKSFTYTFDERPVYFAFSLPYQVARLNKFLAGNTVFDRKELCKSEQGRSVELLTAGNGIRNRTPIRRLRKTSITV